MKTLLGELTRPCFSNFVLKTRLRKYVTNASFPHIFFGWDV